MRRALAMAALALALTTAPAGARRDHTLSGDATRAAVAEVGEVGDRRVEVPEAVCFLIEGQTFAPRFRLPISHDVGVTWLAHNDPS